MLYQHIPLTSNSQTRVLVLQPAQDKSEVLVGSLKVCDLQRSSGSIIPSSPFEALSYVWGPPSSTHTLTLGTASLPITANCDGALRELRWTSKERHLWIDSICIDQTDGGIRERNIQVAMMGDIYEAASDVLVWLGPSDEKTTALLRHFKRLYLIRDDFWEDLRHNLCSKFMNKCEGKWKTSQMWAVQEIIEGLLSRTWFERMWTLQELLLAKHATIMCGTQTMSWDALCQALELIEASFPLSSKGTRNFVNCFYACSDFKEMLEDIENNETDDGVKVLSRMVHHSRIRHATNPKDKIFALYGLSQKLGKPMPQPDYTQSISEIYTRATVAIMQQDNSLWPLENLWSENRRDDLPSWVPDWSEDSRWSDDLNQDLGHVPLDHADRDIPSHWDGPTEPAASIRISSDYKQLVLSGRTLGVVDHVFGDSSRVQAQTETLAATHGTVKYELAIRKHGAETIKLFRMLCCSTSAGDQSEAQLCQLLLTNSPTQPETSFMSGLRALRCVFETEASEKNRRYIFTRARNKLMRATNEMSRHSDVLSYVESDVDAALDAIFAGSDVASHESWVEGDCDRSLFNSLMSAASLYRLIRGLWINRSIFTTDSGLLGYAHGRVLTGDRVVMFVGAEVPSVIRPRGGEFKIQGPAVVKARGSIMDVLQGSLLKEFVLL
ncbi:HET domain-containing protein [Fusarium keratoplasticum]|nr:HET domain-containing protein [Fusarium keratoplasticum]